MLNTTSDKPESQFDILDGDPVLLRPLPPPQKVEEEKRNAIEGILVNLLEEVERLCDEIIDKIYPELNDTYILDDEYGDIRDKINQSRIGFKEYEDAKRNQLRKIRQDSRCRSSGDFFVRQYQQSQDIDKVILSADQEFRIDFIVGKYETMASQNRVYRNGEEDLRASLRVEIYAMVQEIKAEISGMKEFVKEQIDNPESPLYRGELHLTPDIGPVAESDKKFYEDLDKSIGAKIAPELGERIYDILGISKIKDEIMYAFDSKTIGKLLLTEGCREEYARIKGKLKEISDVVSKEEGKISRRNLETYREVPDLLRYYERQYATTMYDIEEGYATSEVQIEGVLDEEFLRVDNMLAIINDALSSANDSLDKFELIGENKLEEYINGVRDSIGLLLSSMGLYNDATFSTDFSAIYSIARRYLGDTSDSHVTKYFNLLRRIIIPNRTSERAEFFRRRVEELRQVTDPLNLMQREIDRLNEEREKLKHERRYLLNKGDHKTEAEWKRLREIDDRLENIRLEMKSLEEAYDKQKEKIFRAKTPSELAATFYYRAQNEKRLLRRLKNMLSFTVLDSFDKSLCCFIKKFIYPKASFFAKIRTKELKEIDKALQDIMRDIDRNMEFLKKVEGLIYIATTEDSINIKNFTSTLQKIIEPIIRGILCTLLLLNENIFNSLKRPIIEWLSKQEDDETSCLPVHAVAEAVIDEINRYRDKVKRNIVNYFKTQHLIIQARDKKIKALARREKFANIIKVIKVLRSEQGEIKKFMANIIKYDTENKARTFVNKQISDFIKKQGWNTSFNENTGEIEIVDILKLCDGNRFNVDEQKEVQIGSLIEKAEAGNLALIAAISKDETRVELLKQRIYITDSIKKEFLNIEDVNLDRGLIFLKSELENNYPSGSIIVKVL